jgi:hypothetical protein
MTGKLVLYDVVITDHTSVFQKARHELSLLPISLPFHDYMNTPHLFLGNAEG